MEDISTAHTSQQSISATILKRTMISIEPAHNFASQLIPDGSATRSSESEKLIIHPQTNMERPVTNRELRGMIVILYHQNTVNKLSNLVLIQHVSSVNNSTCIKRIEELTWESIHQMTRLGEKIDQTNQQIALLSEKIGNQTLKSKRNSPSYLLILKLPIKVCQR